MRRDRTPTRCRDGALHIPGESGWRFAAVRRATRGFLLSTLTLFTVLWAGALSVCLSQFGDDRPLACTTRQPRPVKRLRSCDAVNKSVNRGQPSSPKPREGNARIRSVAAWRGRAVAASAVCTPYRRSRIHGDRFGRSFRRTSLVPWSVAIGNSQ